MNKNSGFSQMIVILVVSILVIGGVVWVVAQNGNQPSDNTMMEEKTDKMEPDSVMDDGNKMDSDAMPAEENMIKDDQMEGSDTMMTKPGSYQDYSPATVEAEQQLGTKVVLFFHAPWCPFCKAANEAFISRASEIPAGVVVLKTDYDSNTELKQKYGVTYQHTFVQIDKNDNQISKWNGGDIDNLKKYLK